MTLIRLISKLRENPAVRIFKNGCDDPFYEGEAEGVANLPVDVLASGVDSIYICNFVMDVYLEARG